jgi:UDP-3-O-[3-hydroxymyristoyl] N-acetylglucosamine deacetylase
MGRRSGSIIAVSLSFMSEANSVFQHTLAKPVTAAGIGLHTGVPINLRLLPAPSNTGIVFKRIDLDDFAIEAKARNVARVSYATSLMRKGVLISTTEHLLSALAGLNVDNAVVELDNLEVPIMDGSALPFTVLIRKAGLRQQRALRTYARITRPVEVSEGLKHIGIYPSEIFRVTYGIDFSHPLIGKQTFEYTPSTDSYISEIAPARTFGFLEEVEELRKNKLVRGGSLENVVVLNGNGVMNPEGLRFGDEFCRHKILDLLGDLAMLGLPILGHVVAKRGGHAMHYALVSKLLREKSSWEAVKPVGDKLDQPEPQETVAATGS